MPVSQTLRKFYSAVRIGKRELFSGVSNPDIDEWQHITKIDPEADKRLPLAYPFFLQHTDAVSVGGSSGVTPQNTEETFSLLQLTDTPAFHEPSAARHVTDDTREMAAFIAIPEVLNGDIKALVGTLGEGLEYLNDEMLPELLANKLPRPLYWLMGESLVDFATSWFLHEAVFEAYIVQNPDSAAAKRSGVTAADVVSPTVARQRAMVADRHLDSEVVYVEYSGTYGGDEATEVLKTITGELSRAQIWYGGGIDSQEKAKTMLTAGADTVVVGDIFHDIADEECQIIERSRRAIGDSPSPTEIQNWVEDEIDVEATDAASYLSTIPTVSQPDRVAKQYFCLMLGLFFSVQSGETESSDVTLDRSVDTIQTVLPDGNKQIKNAFAEPKDGLSTYLTEIVSSACSPGNTDRPFHHISCSNSNPDG